MERRALPAASPERDFEALESGKQRSRAFDLRVRGVWRFPTERKSGQRNYVTLRKRASIASVSNVSAKRSVNERKEQKKTIKTEREKEVRVLIIHMMSAMSLGDRSIH